MEKLTEMNCHRAVRVALSEDTDKTYKFEYNAVLLNGCRYHRLTNEKSGAEKLIIQTHSYELRKYEVLDYKEGAHLAPLYKIAETAHNWTSFDPERAGHLEIMSYEEKLNEDLAKIPESYRSEYEAKFQAKVFDILIRESRIASPMVAGPAKFNYSKNEKANNSYMSAVEQFETWRAKRIHSIIKEVEAALPSEVREGNRWKEIQRDIDRDIEVLRDVNKGSLPNYYRQSCVNALYGHAETIARKGERALLNRYVEYITKCGEKLGKPVFTQRHKFWKLQELCEECIEKEGERSNRTNVEIRKSACTIVKNYAEDRIQILFDEKPDSQKIGELKKNGFRWSPRFGAWQRQLTTNAYHAVARVVPDTTVNELISAM